MVIQGLKIRVLGPAGTFFTFAKAFPFLREMPASAPHKGGTRQAWRLTQRKLSMTNLLALSG